MRNYQYEIYLAVVRKSNWSGSNTLVTTMTNKKNTKVFFHGNLIAVVDHSKRTAKYDNCGFNNGCTSARINAVKDAVKELGYTD